MRMRVPVPLSAVLLLALPTALPGQLPPPAPVSDDGSSSQWLLGATTGFVVGTAAAWVILHQGGSTSLCDRSANQDAIGGRECLGVSAAAGGIPLATIGALIGRRVRKDGDRPGETRTVHVSLLAAIQGRTGVAIRVPF
jgi:hypothetical protein